jgi:L-fucose dehydrogenase
LRDKVVLVTGGAKGIGAAIIRSLVEEGAIPIAIDRDATACEQLRGELKCDKRAHFITVDLSSADNWRATVEQSIQACGRLDALVNNAGINDNVGLETGSPEEFVRSLQRNLLHYYNMAHYALPYLKGTSGNIVNISSKTAVTGQRGTSGYVASKGAILGLTREWGAELLPHGIRVNAVVPAEVMTPLYRQWLDSFPDPEQQLQRVVAKFPLPIA